MKLEFIVDKLTSTTELTEMVNIQGLKGCFEGIPEEIAVVSKELVTTVSNIKTDENKGTVTITLDDNTSGLSDIILNFRGTIYRMLTMDQDKLVKLINGDWKSFDAMGLINATMIHRICDDSSIELLDFEENLKLFGELTIINKYENIFK